MHSKRLNGLRLNSKHINRYNYPGSELRSGSVVQRKVNIIKNRSANNVRAAFGTSQRRITAFDTVTESKGCKKRKIRLKVYIYVQVRLVVSVGKM